MTICRHVCTCRQKTTKSTDIIQQSNNHGNAAVAVGDGGGTMAFGEACWAAIEGSGGAEPRRKMSDEGVGVGVDVVGREGRSDDKTERRRDDEMQHDDATIKQSGRDEMCQGARYIDEARRDATTQRRNDATTRRRDDSMTMRRRDDERQDTAQRRGAATRRDGTRQQGAERRRNNQPNEQTHGRTYKQSRCKVRRRCGNR